MGGRGAETVEAYSQAFTVPATVGSYAPERLTFGEPAAGVSPKAIRQVAAFTQGTAIATAVVELWVLRVGASVPFLDGDYTYVGQTATAWNVWELAGLPGCQLRVKSGGTGGTHTVSASAVLW